MSIGELQKERHQIEMLLPSSLEKMIQANHGFEGKKAYYVGKDRRGEFLFGIAGNARMFHVTGEVYAAIGSPKEGAELKVSIILEKAGYKTQ